MSEETFGFAPPPFKPDEGLQRLRRELRGLGLEEREGAFERRGLRLARVAIENGQLSGAIAKLPARSPDWQSRHIGSSAELREFLAELKKRMAGWSSERDE